ncbi:MAG: hypothetical protein JNK72_25465 [Myxococcales bacterium]|nr:hypothetical protein [Myxococcales bacterium]
MTLGRRLGAESEAKLFRALHRRAVDAPHPPICWDSLDVSSLDETLRESLRATWAARAVSEYRSLGVFAEMMGRLPEAGLALDVHTGLSRLIADEARHTEHCLRLAEALGGADDATVEGPSLRLVDTKLSPRLWLARWTLSMFCVGESASVGLLHAMRDAVEDPCIGAVIAGLLRDEAMHDRFGWALAETLVPALSDDEREWLGADLAYVFSHYDRMHAGATGDVDALPTPPEIPGPGAAFGVVDAACFARAWYTRVGEVILPGLAALGVPAYEAWSLRRELAAPA